MLAFILSNPYARIAIAVFMALAIGLPVAHHQGVMSERLTQAKESAKIKDYYQGLVFKLNDEHARKDKAANTKYKDLQDEMVKINDDLRSCQLKPAVVRVVYKSANVQTSTSSSSNARANAAESADTLRSMTCEDLSETLLVHDELYFQCKNKLDFFQALFKS